MSVAGAALSFISFFFSFFFQWHQLFESAELAEPLSFSAEEEHNKRSMAGHKLSLPRKNTAISKCHLQEIVDVFVGMH